MTTSGIPQPGFGGSAPSRWLRQAYEEASRLDGAGLEAICPTCFEIADTGPRYNQQEMIGRGATKEVFRAYDLRMKRWVALAVVREDCGPETYDRFVHEAWLTSALSHPNIIAIHDLGLCDDGRPFFTMDLKGATTLAKVVEHPGRLPLAERLGILSKICDAVAHAHARGIVHLDLKPENIQVDDFGGVLVCDWGLGRVIGAPPAGVGEAPGPAAPSDDLLRLVEEHDNESLHGEVRGTPGYMAPEQCDPGLDKDARADVFALGCLLHAIVTGKPPLTGYPSAGPVRPPAPAHAPDAAPMPVGVEAIFRKATAGDPAARYPTVGTMRHDLAAYLGGYSTAAEHAGFLREAGLFLRRNRAAAAISLLGTVAITVVSVLLVQKLDHQRKVASLARERAARLTERAGELESLYQTQSAAIRQRSREMAADFAQSANTLKNLGIFNSPLNGVGEAMQLADTALSLDPECASARLELFDLRCHILDFKGALAAPPVTDHPLYADYLKIAAAAPDFGYSRQDRPPARELAGFLRRAAALEVRRAPLMERIVSYDAAARRDFEDYHEVVSALLAYANPGFDGAGLRYATAGHTLAISSAVPVRLAIPPGGGSGWCLLRFIPVRTLTLEISAPVDLHQLDGMLMETLDLRGCGRVACSGFTRLPGLRVMRLRPGQADPEALNTLIGSSARIAIKVGGN